MQDQHIRGVSDQGDGDEIALDVVRQRRVDSRGRDHDGAARHQERMTVRRGMRDDLGADPARSAASIVDDRLLLERLRQLLRDETISGGTSWLEAGAAPFTWRGLSPQVESSRA